MRSFKVIAPVGQPFPVTKKRLKLLEKEQQDRYRAFVAQQISLPNGAKLTICRPALQP